jgi:hypothetical protein
MQEAWVERIQTLCNNNQVLFFFKQWGGTQKSKTGRLLNGRTFDAMPNRVVAPIPTRQNRQAAARPWKARAGLIAEANGFVTLQTAKASP